MCLSCTGHVPHGVVSWSWHPSLGNMDLNGIWRLAQQNRFISCIVCHGIFYTLLHAGPR